MARVAMNFFFYLPCRCGKYANLNHSTFAKRCKIYLPRRPLKFTLYAKPQESLIFVENSKNGIIFGVYAPGWTSYRHISLMDYPFSDLPPDGICKPTDRMAAAPRRSPLALPSVRTANALPMLATVPRRRSQLSHRLQTSPYSFIIPGLLFRAE